MAELVPAPILDIRNEALITAQAIARVSGALTIEQCDHNIEVMREYRQMLLDGTLPTPPACPELTDANVSSPHMPLIGAFAWLVAFVTRAVHQVPDQNKIEFARLFKIELREATPATTTLRFTAAAPVGVATVILEGTAVQTASGSAVFTTDEELIIAAGETEGTVSATRTVSGKTTLAPNTVTQLAEPVEWVTGVTNLAAIESGSDKETVNSALERARHKQRRAEHLVNARDLQEAILEEVLLGNGIVKVFDLIKDGEWLNPDGSVAVIAGHTTIVVMTSTGNPFSDEVKQLVIAKTKEMVGAIFPYIKDPTFVDFDVEADVRLTGLVTQSAALAAAEKNLRDFYAAKESNFGRTISRSEIIGIIENTDGILRIEPQPGGAILISPGADVNVAPYELPRLGQVTLNVVS